MYSLRTRILNEISGLILERPACETIPFDFHRIWKETSPGPLRVSCEKCGAVLWEEKTKEES